MGADVELTTCLSQLEYCSSKIAGALSAVNACAKTVASSPAGADDLVALCDILRQYISDFWQAYDEAQRLLHKPSDTDVRTALEWIERHCQPSDL